MKREQVVEWLVDAQGRDPKDVIAAKLEELGLTDTSVDMGDPHGIMTLAQIIAEEFDLE